MKKKLTNIGGTSANVVRDAPIDAVVHVIERAAALRPRPIRGQDCAAVAMTLDGSVIAGLSPHSLVEMDGTMTSTWHIHDVADLAKIDGREVEIVTTFASPIGDHRRCRWAGKVAGIGVAGRPNHVTVTVVGTRRSWDKGTV